MIDGFLNTLRKTGERVQRRGEEVAQGARLRLDIFQLGRELDALYARLGRAYHSNAAVSTLEEVRAEIARVDEEIAARELLLAELGTDLNTSGESSAGADAGAPVNLVKARTPAPSPFAVTAFPGVQAVQPEEGEAQVVQQAIQTEVSSTTDTDPQTAQSMTAQSTTALGVWREKEAARMSDENLKTGPVTDATGRPDGEDADPTRSPGGDAHRSPYAGPGGQATSPNEAGTGEKLQPTPDTASMGNEAARDGMVRHDNHLKEGQTATLDPDPLASKD